MFSGKLGVMKQKWGHSSSLSFHYNYKITHIYTHIRTYTGHHSITTLQSMVWRHQQWPNLFFPWQLGWGGADLRNERWKRESEKRDEEGHSDLSPPHYFQPLDHSWFLLSFHTAHLCCSLILLCATLNFVYFDLLLSLSANSLCASRMHQGLLCQRHSSGIWNK